ncbi:Hypothetical protein, putative [Bodo saltans]|uniref:UBA domain-containing protein n=1 Tax=Bodo saltans TaxID=75058 RepID=A0A0S4JIU8_BODSA|nr:Hypothetical protein, putative [Bodo saltans]|eukprot:CUG88341.1 Hypothetical protein, putative [Bodo saltans]
MKLKVRQTGLVSKELEVNIRNPSATMANVRAAIAILFKLDPHSFKMVRGAAGSTSEQLEDSVKLSATGLSEGDLIVLVAKRSRTDDNVVDVAAQEAAEVAAAVAAAAAATATVGSSTATTTTPGTSVTTAAAPAALTSSTTTPALTPTSAAPPAGASSSSVVVPNSTASASRSGTTTTAERPTVPQKRMRKAATISDRTTAPHVINAADQLDTFLAQRMEADDAEARAAIRDDQNGDENDDDDDDDIFDGEEDEEEMDEQDEVQEMVSHLLAVPNILDMRRQFLENPQAVLQQIQNENPRLFQLISAHNQAFLDLVENETLLEALREEQEAEEAYIGGSDEEDEGDEEFDEDDESALHELILNALGAAAADEEREMMRRSGSNQRRGGNGGGATTAGNSAATSVTLGRNATQILDSLRSTVSDGGAADNISTSNNDTKTEVNNSEGATTVPTSRQRGSIPLVISDDDKQKIEGLTHLGFTTEQCTAAFFLANRSIERAANLLFEDPPTL